MTIDTSADAVDPGAETPDPRFPNLTRGAVRAAAVAVYAAVVGAAPLYDNSFMTHLTTGRLMMAGHLPHSDPYTFTAPGQRWVVQSWLVSLIYGLADRVGGYAGIRVVVAVVTVAVALLAWRLTQPARQVTGRVLAIFPTLLMADFAWGARPLLFGLLFFVATMVILRERRDPRWLVPIMWLWVNTHGSFPLGFVYVGVVTVGRRLDGVRDLSAELRALGWMAAGTALAALNPLGPVILWFPVELLQKQKVLANLIEWQAPTFTSLWQRVFLVQLVAVIALAPRLRGSRRYQEVLPVAVFTGAALIGSRNVVLAGLVMLPVLSRELRGVGKLDSAARERANGYVVVGLAVVAVAVSTLRIQLPDWNLGGYPVRSVDWLQQEGLLSKQHRIASGDYTGNYIEWRTRGKVPVFIDDRVDMFPPMVDRDFATLMNGGSQWRTVLDRWHIDVVLWSSSLPLTTILGQPSSGWRLVHHDGAWNIYRRTS